MAIVANSIGEAPSTLQERWPIPPGTVQAGGPVDPSPRRPEHNVSPPLLDLLSQVRDGTLSPEAAAAALGTDGGLSLGFARLDVGRVDRTGEPEVVYGAGKTAAQIISLLQRLHDAGQPALATRVDAAKAAVVCDALPDVIFHDLARILEWPVVPAADPVGPPVAVVCAGTSDLPVAEEARCTLEALGTPTRTHYDIGVAGLHRLLSQLPALREAPVLVVVAGMEGALPTVLAGLVSAPVIAVPTSVGYGSHLSGITPMLGMLTACAPGISVVNIDNGFGAALVARRIQRLAVTP